MLNKILLFIKYIFVHNIKNIATLCLFVFIVFSTNFSPFIGLINTTTVVFLVSCVIFYIFTRFKNDNMPRFIIWSFCGMFLCYFLMYFSDGESLKTFQREFSVKYALILFPIAFLFLPKLDKIHYLIIFITFIACVFTLTSVGIYNYYHNKYIKVVCESCIDSGAISYQLMPFHLGHHMLSVFNNLAIIFTLILTSKYFDLKSSIKYLLYVLIAIFVVFIHFIGARIGVLAFYGMILTFGIYYSFKYKNAKYYFISSIFLILLLLKLLYSFDDKTKIRVDDTIAQVNYVLWNQSDYGSNFSSRLMAMNVAKSILTDDPMWGCKFSKEEEVYKQKYLDLYGISKNAHSWGNVALKPHIEFLRMMAIMGLPIGILFMIFYFIPFFTKPLRDNIYLLLFYVPNTIFCFTDMPFEMWYWYYSFSMITPFLLHFFYATRHETIN